LIPLVTLLDYEVAFRPVAPPPFADVALAVTPEATRVVVNFGALQCLSAWAAALESCGWILVNDYGAASTADVSEHATAQRFGVTSAVGINFPLVERFLSDRGLTVLQPDGDRERAIHTRLITAESLPRTAEALRSRFSLEADRFIQEPIGQARSHAAAGRLNEALEEYKLGLARNPRDWYVLGEVADFVGQRLHDWSAAAELARAAVELNPWYSGWLWNVLGDCLYGLGRVDASHEAYLQAHRIDPLDARTNLELAFTWAQRGQYDEALAAIARGLAHDRQASFRERFLEKQQHVLATIAGRRLGEHERLAKRLSYFRSVPGT
jgi:tetratricopeptide (TPR) repeat protein